MSQQEEDPSRYTRTLVFKPALSQMYDQLLPTSKSLEMACKHHCACTHRSAPRHVSVPRSWNFSDVSTVFTVSEKSIDRRSMPDKSWRGMRPGPVTALCTSYAFPDCIPTFASSFICSGEKLTWIFFLLALFWNTSKFIQIFKCVYLPESEKMCHFQQLCMKNESPPNRQCSILSDRHWGEPSQSTKGPISFSYTVFHDPAGRSSESLLSDDRPAGSWNTV